MHETPSYGDFPKIFCILPGLTTLVIAIRDAE